MSEKYSVKAVLSAEDGSFRSVFNNAQGILSRFGNSTGGVMGKLSNMKSMVTSGLGFGVWSGIGQRAFDTVGKAVQGVTSNLGGAISRYDTLKQFPRVMEMMGYKTEETERASKKLVDAIDGLPTTLDGITANAQNIAMITGNLDKATDTTIALNNAFLMSGASADAAQRGLTQYVQMMSAGKVDMQSWKTLLETMSPALTKVAESFGYTGESAKSDLYDALKSGKITFDQFNQRLIEMNDGMDVAGKHFDGFAALAKEGTKGIGTSIENLKVTITKNLANMIKAFDDSGLSIAESIDGIKQKINEGMKGFLASDTFNAIVDAGLKTKEALVKAFDEFANSPAFQTIKDNLTIIAENLGVILPKTIEALSPVVGAILSGVAKVAGAISTMVREVTENPAFMKFAEAIAGAIERIGNIATKVISHLQPYISAIMDAAADVINAFGEAADAIMDSAHKANSADKAYSNFQKVLGIVKGALMGVADFLKKHHSLILWVIEHLPTIIALVGATKIALMGMQKIQAFVGLISQVKQFGESIGGTAKKVKDFVSGIGKHFSNISGATKTAGDAVYSLAGKFTNVETGAKGAIYNVSNAFGGVGTAAGKAGQDISNGFGAGFTGAINVTSSSVGKMSNTISSGMGGALGGIKGFFSNVGSTISGALSNVASGVGTAVGKVASGIGSVVSTIGSIAGPIAMVAGPAIAAITGIVSAIKAWREKQKEMAREIVAYTDDQQKAIDKNNELIKSYNDLHDSASGKVADSEAEFAQIQSIRDEYSKLIDSNGKVIEGKEKLADTLRGKLYEAVGIEKSQVDELRNEYLKLIDENGNVISGYETRAEEIKKSLSEILGQEITKTDQVKNLANGEMAAIDQLIEKKHLEAQASVLDEAYKDAFKQKAELYKEEQNLIETRTQKAKELADMERGIYAEGIDNETKRREAKAETQRQLDELDEKLKENRDTQLQCESDMALSTESWAAAADGDYGKMSVLMARYVGDLQSAEDAVRIHGANAKEALEQQVSTAQESYNKIKAAYDNHETGVTETQVKEQEARLDYAKSAYNDLLTNTELGLAQQLEAEVRAHKDSLSELDSQMNDIKKKRDYQYSTEYTQLNQRIADEKAQLATAEKNYQEYLNNLNTKSEKGYSDLNTTTQTGMNNVVSSVAGAQPKLSTGAQNNANAILNPFSLLAGTLPQSVQRTMANANSQVSGSQKTLESSTSAVTNSMLSVVGGMTPQMRQKTAESMNAMQAGISKSGSGAVRTTNSVIREILNNATIDALKTRGYGQNVIFGLQAGMNAEAYRVYNTARAIANTVASTIAGALQIHSPSKLTTKYGEYVIQGLVNGIKNNVNKVVEMEKYLASTAKETFSSAVISKVEKSTASKIAELNNELSKYKTDQNSSHATYVSDQRKTLSDFKTQKNKELTDYKNTAVKSYNDAVAKAKRSLSQSGNNKISELNAYIADQGRQLQKRLNSINGSKSKNKKSQINQAYADYDYNVAMKKAALTRNMSSKELAYLNKVADAKIQMERKIQSKTESINRAIAAKENTINDNIAKNLRKVNQNITNQETKTKNSIKQVEAEKSEEYVSAAQKRLDTLKHYNKINQAQEVEYWKNILAVCKKGTEGYESAYMKLYDAKAALKDSAADLTKTFVSEITSKYDELESAISSRAESLRNAFKLFDRATAGNGTAKSSLISNLQSQIDYYKKYDKVMTSLKKKFGANSELYQELQGMDISELTTLDQIDKMTKAERDAYAKLYNEKQKLTRARAEGENVALEKSIKNQITSLTKAYEKEIISLGLGLSETSKDIGAQIVNGISKGLSEGKKGLSEYLKNLANTMVATVKKELDIHSPSRVMEGIGNMTVKGYVNGLQGESGTVEKVMTGIAESTTKALDNIILFPTIDNIQSELQAINRQASMDINSKTLENINQNIVVQATLDVDGRTFSQTMAPNTSRAMSENKRRRRA